MTKVRLAALLAPVLALSPAGAAPHDELPAACTAVRTVAELSNIRNNLAGNYCLANDIDAAATANFQPIGDPQHPLTNPFRGTLDGAGHVIKNLKITTSINEAGLIMRVAKTGAVKNLGLVDVNVNATTVSSLVGGIAGVMSDTAKITNVYVTGIVRARASASVGGVVGRKEGGTISLSYSRASIVGASQNLIGGFVGEQLGGTISLSFATGAVTSGDSNNMGGFSGLNENGAIIRQSFASGAVTSGANGYVGGFVGHNDGPVTQVFALGNVTAGDFATIGGLIGTATSEGTVTQAYAAGAVTAGQFANIGGLIGFGVGTVSAAYWDNQTTGRTTSSNGGTGMSTAQLQAALPADFAGTVWGINRGVTYPYIKLAGLKFWAPLAAIVANNKVFDFAPLSQQERGQYTTPIAPSDQVSRAAALTILARAIGFARNVATFKSVKINTFWNAATKQAVWTAPGPTYATLGAVKPIGATISQANVIGELKLRHPVLIGGVYQKAGLNHAHWMLATSFIVTGTTVTALVADDPWTGQQVRISPTTRKVIDPAGFPLTDFTVSQYQAVTLK